MLKEFKIRNYILAISMFLTLFLAQSNNAFSQKNIQKGDELFDKNQFEEALPFYLSEADDKKSKYIKQALLKVGKTYDILGKFLESEKAYLRLYKLESKNWEYLKLYALALKAGAKYDEAAKQFKIYAKMNPQDPMGKNYLESCYLAQLWLDENIQTKTQNLDSINSKENDISPVLNNGKLYYCSAKPGSIPMPAGVDGLTEDTKLDIYYTDFNKAFTTDNKSVNFEEINTYGHEGPVTFSADGNEVYFTKPVLGKIHRKSVFVLNPLQIFYSKKGADGKWSIPVSAFTFNSNTYSVGHPALRKDGKRIYYFSDMPGGLGGSDIYYSEKQADGSWGAPINVGPVINTFGFELFPTLKDDTTLCFSSNIHPGLGKLDIFSTTFTGGKWTEVENLKPPINSISDDYGIAFDPNYPRGFFTSSRFNGHGKDDIYSFIEAIPTEFIVNGKKISFLDQSMYDGSKFKLTDTDTKEEMPLSLIAGLFSFDLIPDKNYTLTVRKEGFAYNKIAFKLYFNQTKNRYQIDVKSNAKPVTMLGDFEDHGITIDNYDDFNGIEVLSSNDKHIDGVKGKYPLEFKALYKIIAKPKDKKVAALGIDGLVKSATNHPVENVQLFLSHDGKIIDSTFSNPKANFAFKIESGMKYTITAIKPGFFQKDIEVNAIDVESGNINTEIVLDSIELNKTVRINNIYYDYNKADLRPTSLPELDKLIHFLHANPTLVIEISSHTDARGNDEYNLDLSSHRAESVVKYLIANGIPKAKLVAKGYGETVLIVPSASTEEEHQMNRRTEFKVLKIK